MLRHRDLFVSIYRTHLQSVILKLKRWVVRLLRMMAPVVPFCTFLLGSLIKIQSGKRYLYDYRATSGPRVSCKGLGFGT